jgi:hypothetical protein
MLIVGLLLAAQNDGVEFFEKRVRPVLVEHCYACHSAGAKKLRGGLRLDTREDARKGGDGGPAVVPGKPDESLLLKAVRSVEPDSQMPPKGRLPEGVIADLVRWVELGAPDPREGTAVAAAGPTGPPIEEGRKWWAFRPLGDVAPPAPGHPVDAFLDAELRRRGLDPAPEVDRATLIRRVTFDLTGLPPTAEEAAAFERDDAPGAWERVVDRLLASPRYGERWGRRWLDLMRYADSNGVDEDVNHPHAWRYRDWVIRAFNDDLPWPRFVEAQLAGDLVEGAGADGLVAVAWLALGPKMLAEPDLEKMRMDIADEQIDVMSKTFLGLTISCARCHDHKFDPVSAPDYYALAGIFRSTTVIADDSKRPAILHEHELPDGANAAKREAHRKEVERLKAEAGAEKDEKKAKELKEKAKKLEADGPELPRSLGPKEIAPKDLAVHLRGSHLALAKEKTPRGTPRVFEIAMAPIARGSGRLELARWLNDPGQALPARVMVNRIWQGHFGEGLVRTASNFGLKGETPSHPALLDFLAREFRGSGSVKAMHRLLLTSAAYRRSSAGRPSDLDPENRLLARQNRRRLDAEEIRDALLALGGSLDLEVGGTVKGAQTGRDYYRAGESLYAIPRRTVYLPVARHKTYDLLQVFDYADTAVHLEKRPATIVPQQALFMLNNPLVRGQAAAVAKSLQGTDEEKLDALWPRLFARSATSSDRGDALRALARLRERGAADPWARLVHALLASNEFMFVD